MRERTIEISESVMGRLRDLSGTEMKVYLAIRWAQQFDLDNIDVPELAEMTGVSPTLVRKAVKELQKLQFPGIILPS